MKAHKCTDFSGLLFSAFIEACIKGLDPNPVNQEYQLSVQTVLIYILEHIVRKIFGCIQTSFQLTWTEVKCREFGKNYDTLKANLILNMLCYTKLKPTHSSLFFRKGIAVNLDHLYLANSTTIEQYAHLLHKFLFQHVPVRHVKTCKIGKKNVSNRNSLTFEE